MNARALHVRGAILRDLREAKDRSRQSAATEVGVTEKTFKSWEDNGPIQPHNLATLAAYYGVDPASLTEKAPVKRKPQQLPQLDRIEAKIDQILAALRPPGEAEAGQPMPQPPPAPTRQAASAARPRKARKAS